MDETGAQIAEEIEQAIDELGWVDALWTALCYERAYGGGLILMGINDGHPLDKPLDEENIQSVDHLTVFSGGPTGEASVWSWYGDPRSKNYGRPELYLIRTVMPPGITPGKIEAPEPLMLVHESRCLVFDGKPVSREAAMQGRGWGDSLFTRIDRILQQYDQSWGGVAVAMTELNQNVLAVDNLLQLMATKGRVDNPSAGVAYGSIAARAQLLQMTKSISRTVLLDREKETLTNLQIQFGGVAEVLQQFALRLAAGADMPVALLFGQAPAGLNATGASDIRFFYDGVMAEMEKRLQPRLRRLVRYVFLSAQGPTEGEEPEHWEIKFNPLYQLTALEEADLRLKVAQMDAANITSGLYTAEEAAASAYAGSGFTIERTLDLAGRQQMAADAEKAAAERKAKLMAAAGPAGSPQPPGVAAPAEPAPPQPPPPDETKP